MDEYKSEQIEELRSELYYKLKDEYIELRKEYDLLIIKLKKEQERFKRLKVGRRFFNFAIKLSKSVITNHAIEHNYDLDSVCSLVNKIESLKKPPIRKEGINNAKNFYKLVSESEKDAFDENDENLLR